MAGAGEAGSKPSSLEAPLLLRPPPYGDRDAYTICRPLLGEGRFSEVYAGRHAASGAAVAIKVVKYARAQDVAWEASVLRALAGVPHVLALWDVLEGDGVAAAGLLVVERVEVTPWAAVCAAASADPALGAAYARQLFEALAGAHARGVAHRDVQPRNVLVDHARRRLVLADWGVAAAVGSGSGSGSGATQPVGTPGFRAPEVLAGRRHDAAVDVWSAGCWLYELLSGGARLVAGREHPLDELAAAVEAVRRLDAAPTAALPAAAARFIKRCLAVHPGVRPSAAALLADPYLATASGSSSAVQTG